jgi:trypsin
VHAYLARLRHGNLHHGVGGTVYTLDTIIIHELYTQNSFDYNIAVIKVKESFESKNVIPLASVTPSRGTIVTSAGFGLLNAMRVQLGAQSYPVFDHESCGKTMGDMVTDRVLCAGHVGTELCPCGGDVGGPLAFNETLVGVVMTTKCGSSKETMGLFTDISNLRLWVQLKINLPIG